MKSRVDFEQPTSIAVVRDMFNGDFVPNFKIGTGSGTFDCPGCGMILGSLMVCGKSVESFNEQDFLVVGHVDPVHPDHGSSWVKKCPLQNKRVDLSKVRSRDLLHGIPSWMYWDESGHHKPNWLVELEYMEKIEDPGMEYETAYIHGQTGRWGFSKQRYAEYERVKRGEIALEAFKIGEQIDGLESGIPVPEINWIDVKPHLNTVTINYAYKADEILAYDCHYHADTSAQTVEYEFDGKTIKRNNSPVFSEPEIEETRILQRDFFVKYRDFIPDSYNKFAEECGIH